MKFWWSFAEYFPRFMTQTMEHLSSHLKATRRPCTVLLILGMVRDLLEMFLKNFDLIRDHVPQTDWSVS